MPRSAAATAWSQARPVFAALGDARRLRIVARLCEEGPLSATRLAEGARVSRQALAKHLRVLAVARLVTGARAGREVLFRLEPVPLDAARQLLDGIAREWDGRLARLRAIVEAGPRPGRRGEPLHGRHARVNPGRMQTGGSYSSYERGQGHDPRG